VEGSEAGKPIKNNQFMFVQSIFICKIEFEGTHGRSPRLSHGICAMHVG
jgi:hypothetical protein